MFGCYRKHDANDPEIYVAAVASILNEYPPAIIDYVCDPRTGVANELKWLPTIAEISAACDTRLEYSKLRMRADAIAREKQAIVEDPDASPAQKAQAQYWLEHRESLKR